MMMTYNGKLPGDYEVTNRGIEIITGVEDGGYYTSKVILPRDVFIEAYKKWILEKKE